jgi:hypothetical protein
LTELERSKAFVDASKVTCLWSREYSTAEYVKLMGTHSSHRMLDDASRRRLQAGVAAVIDAHGGTIDVGGRTLLYLARAR